MKNRKTIIIILETIENINKQKYQEKLLIILYTYYQLFFIDSYFAYWYQAGVVSALLMSTKK